MSAVALLVEFSNVLAVIDEFVRLKASIPRALPSNTLLEMVMFVAGFVASVEEKSRPASLLPVKVLPSIRTSDTVPPALNWSV